MAFWRTLLWVYIFMVITLMISSPFVHSSRLCSQCGKEMAEHRATEMFTQEKRFGNGGSGFNVEASAREVPTGPDPLHHNKQPSRP